MNKFLSDGDLGPTNSVLQAYMKQKHRHIWERRHGPVGSGMKGEAAHWVKFNWNIENDVLMGNCNKWKND